MSNCIMVACDLHDKTMRLKVAVGKGEAVDWSLSNDRRGRNELQKRLKERSREMGGAEVLFAYEASGQRCGFPILKSATTAR